MLPTENSSRNKFWTSQKVPDMTGNGSGSTTFLEKYWRWIPKSFLLHSAEIVFSWFSFSVNKEKSIFFFCDFPQKYPPAVNTETSVADPDPYVFGLPWSGSVSTRYGPWFLLICDFFTTFYFKIDVNVPSKSKNQKYFLVTNVLKVTDKNSRIRVRIHTKMSRIRNTDRNINLTNF
jgi:hypothetical protein